MSVSDLGEDWPILSTRSKAQQERTNQKGTWNSSRACETCHNFRDGLRCGQRYNEVRFERLKDCWRPIGTVLVWDESPVPMMI